jgi:MoaA/NifB/PqqE/SkfB family radical SAM enzyme
MSMRSRLRRILKPALSEYPHLWQIAKSADLHLERARNTLAERLPVLVRPEPRHLEIALTAQCNLRCIGCRYGREFMPGHQLSYEMVNTLLEDARDAGCWDVRFYGGEPLLHPDLPRMIARAIELDLEPYVTTNGIRLKDRIDELHAAGLRTINIGFYGTGGHYDAYVQRSGRFRMLEHSLETLRQRYGSDITLRINWLLMRPTCNIEALHEAWNFAERFDARFQVDLIHYSLPYFTEGPDQCLQFRPSDRPDIECVTAEILRLKAERPDRINMELPALRSIPEWLVQRNGMRVPCDSHQMLWVGADGTVQQCYVTFRLGNLHESRLRDMLFTQAHVEAARDSYALDCPNCHCHYPARVMKHAPTLERYSAPTTFPAPAPAAAPAGAPLSRPVVACD